MQTSNGVLYVQARMSVIAGHIPLDWYTDDTIDVGLHKYSAEVYDACIKSFQALPVTALVDRKFFCVHGGISPELDTLRDIDLVSFAADALERGSYAMARSIDSRSPHRRACSATCYGRIPFPTSAMRSVVLNVCKPLLADICCPPVARSHT